MHRNLGVNFLVMDPTPKSGSIRVAGRNGERRKEVMEVAYKIPFLFIYGPLFILGVCVGVVMYFSRRKRTQRKK